MISDLVRGIRPSSMRSSKYFATSSCRVIVNSFFAGPFFLPIGLGNTRQKYLTPLPYSCVVSWYYRSMTRSREGANMRPKEDMETRMAEYRERLELDMDRASKAVLDAAVRLSWMDKPATPAMMEKWTEAIVAALTYLEATRGANHGRA
jgi:hypothetical protein